MPPLCRTERHACCRPWSRTVPLVLSIPIFGLVAAPARAEPTNPRPLVLRIAIRDEPISPVTERYVGRAIAQASAAKAEALVLELDTPGGLTHSTRHIVREILASRVPVVVYVTPAGGRAASAGLFISLAAHVAAMAPGTHIGAAHPVWLGGPLAPKRRSEPQGTNDTPHERASPEEEKVVEDAEAWARALAETRGRNGDWAARAVTESASLTARGAFERGVVDLLAGDFDELLARIDGRRVAEGSPALRTRNAEVRFVEMWWGEKVLGALANPTLAFLLLVIGFYAVLAELYGSPGGVAGVAGALCILTAFAGLALLPINLTGLLLLVLSFGLFVAEAYVTSYGALAAGGIVSMVLGGLMLIDSPTGLLRVSLPALLAVAIASATIAVFLLGNVIRSQRSEPRTGAEGLLRERGVAEADFEWRGDDKGEAAEGRFRGTVRLHGERWTALSPAPVARGQEVRVTGRRGLELEVAPTDPKSWQPSFAARPSREPGGGTP